MKTMLIHAVGCIALLAVTTGQRAEALTLDLGIVYTGSTPGGTAPWVTVTINDITANTVNVRVDHNASSATGQFVSDVYLNLNPFVSPIVLSNEINANKRNGVISLSNNGVNGAAGNNFDLGISFKTSNAQSGVNRLKPGEFWSADFSGTGLSAASFFAANNRGNFVGAHVQGISGGLSGHITAVPEPATLTALALGAAAVLRRRRK